MDMSFNGQYGEQQSNWRTTIPESQDCCHLQSITDFCH